MCQTQILADDTGADAIDQGGYTQSELNGMISEQEKKIKIWIWISEKQSWT